MQNCAVGYALTPPYSLLQRDTLKRTCIKTLPPLLMVQLKRFGYDWEANRAIKYDDFFEVSLEGCRRGRKGGGRGEGGGIGEGEGGRERRSRYDVETNSVIQV